MTEADLFKALPDRSRSMQQTGMVYTLSEPTERSLLRAGEMPAFGPDLGYPAYQAVGRFRRRLRSISSSIDQRNLKRGVHYTYLKPQNIDRSIAI